MELKILGVTRGKKVLIKKTKFTRTQTLNALKHVEAHIDAPVFAESLATAPENFINFVPIAKRDRFLNGRLQETINK